MKRYVMIDNFICNHCYKEYFDNTLQQYDPCHECGGEIIKIPENFNANDWRDYFKSESVKFGSPGSIRIIDTLVSFYEKHYAEQLRTELLESGLCAQSEIYKEYERFFVWGFSVTKLSELDKIVEELEEILTKYPGFNYYNSIKIRFWD